MFRCAHVEIKIKLKFKNVIFFFFCDPDKSGQYRCPENLDFEQIFGLCLKNNFQLSVRNTDDDIIDSTAGQEEFSRHCARGNGSRKGC